MPNSNYNGGFPHGVSIRQVPLIETQSGFCNTFWVDSNKGSDLYPGTFTQPFATLDHAIGQCTASQGDRIMVAAGHAETVIAAGGINCDIAGVTIEFLGDGANKATITFGTDVAASLTVTAANVTLINPRFVAGIDALTGPISISAANCSIIGGYWLDGTSIDTTDCIVATSAATGLTINGWEYVAGNEAGTQKQSQIQLNGVDNAIIKNVKIAGDFATGNIENITDELLNVFFEGLVLKNTNASPTPTMVLDADCTGQAKDVDLRIASGTTYVSSVAKLNWDNNCLGYNADGYAGDPVGTPAASSIEGKIDSIQADIGDPSSRTNFQNLEDMIGIPDAVNSSLDDMLRTGFDSSAIAQNENGSVMERLEFLQQQIVPDVAGLVYSGTCDSGMVGSTTTIVSAHLSGYGDDIFNNKYYIQVIKNDNSVGATPELQVRKVTDYVSATGTFTTDSFGGNVEANDKILVVHESLVQVGRDDANNTIDTSNVVANEDGSVLERLEFIQQQAVPDLSGLVFSGTCDTGMVASTTTVVCSHLSGYGDDTFNTKYFMQVVKNTNSVGNAPETQVRQITDYVSTTGTFTVTAFGANVEEGDKVLVFHESLALLGRDDANNTFDSSNVVANADGSMVERQEYLQTVADTVNTNIGDPSGDTLTTITAKLGDGATTVAADFTTLKTNVGDPSGDTLTSLTAKLGDSANPVGTQLDTVNTNIGDPSGDTLTTITAKLGDGGTSVAADLSTLKTDIGDPSGDTLTSLTAKLGDSANPVGTQLDTVNTNIGDPSGDTLTTITAKLGDGATTVTADLSTIKGDTSKIEDASVTANPANGSLASFIATGGTLVGTRLAASRSILDALGSDGITLSYGSGTMLGAVGTTFCVKKTLISSDITQAGVDVTGVSSGGDLGILDVALQTDSTGLAGGTNKILYTNNTKGAADFLSEAVGNLGANATVTLASASVTGCAGVLESGKKIIMRSTVADGTGAGTVDIYILFRRLSAGATIAAA